VGKHYKYILIDYYKHFIIYFHGLMNSVELCTPIQTYVFIVTFLTKG